MEQLRRLLDPKNWPVQPGRYVIVEGEIYWFVSDDPMEERVRKVLYQGALQ